MSLNALLNHVLYQGGVASSETPYKYQVALDGVGYMLDLDRGFSQPFEHSSIPLLRTQGDGSNEPAEASINPEDLWRRGQSDWGLGAGQSWLDKAAQDRPASSRRRFRTSKGVNVWTENELSLLNDTDSKVSSANSNIQVIAAGARVYRIDGQTLTYTTDPTAGTPSWTTVASTPAATPGTISALASDGYNVWVAYNASGIYDTNTGTSAAAAYRTGQVDTIAYVKGRLMCSAGPSIYNVTSGGGGALPTALFTQANTDFDWVGFAAGHSQIYAGGLSGDKSLIYRIPVKADGSGLDLPVVAGELPDGETITSIGGYLGFIFVGTSRGIRFASADAQGNLTFGAPFGPTSCLCFEGQDRFVWFGWTNYDSASTGLGRFDLTAFGDVERRQPAYATDLMATTQGSVRSVITWGNKRYFTVGADGMWGQDTPLVASGTLETGLIGFDLPEDKVAVQLRTRYGSSFAGTFKASIASDLGMTFTSVGSKLDTETDLSGSVWSLGQTSAEAFELRFTLTRDASATSTGPKLTRWVMRAEPAANLTYKIIWPLIFADRLDVEYGTEEYLDPPTEVARIKAWHANRTVLTAQEGDTSYPALISDYEWRPTHQMFDKSGWNGTMTVRLKVIS